MKRYLLLFSVILLFSSCTDDVKFNNPAFQGLKDNVFWRAVSYKAQVGSNGEVIIIGQLGYETITLQTASQEPKTYTLGVDDLSKATYSNSFQSQLADFSTGTSKGNGQIVITDYDKVANTISGTFRFNAVNEDEEETENPTINFTEGVFYKVPITNKL